MVNVGKYTIHGSYGYVYLEGTLMCIIFWTVGEDTLLHHKCIAQIRSTLPPSMEMDYGYWEELKHHFGHQKDCHCCNSKMVAERVVE